MNVALRLPAMICALVATGAAWPQVGYPVKPVRVVLGFPPASAADIVARVTGAKMSDGRHTGAIRNLRPRGNSEVGARRAGVGSDT